MGTIISLIVLVLIITIYDYASARSWQQASSSNRNDLVFEHRNKSYGAYTLRKEYDKRMMIIIFSLLGAIALLYTAWMIYKSIPEVKPPPPPVDTTQMTVPAPHAEDEIPPPPPPPEDDIPPPVEETVAFIAPVVTDDPEQETEITIPDDKIKADTKTEQGVGNGFEEYGEPVDDPDEPEIVPDKEPEPETFVDEEAEFPGGYPAMMAFIQKNLVFPETAIENGVQGKCFLRFVVSVNGTISSVQVTKGVPDCPDCDKAAIKAIRSMPNWKPGKLNGRSVSSYCSIPINFAIE
jgi:protein TonB